MEIRALGEKLEVLHEAEWAELVRMQQLQIQLLERPVSAGGADGGAVDAPAR